MQQSVSHQLRSETFPSLYPNFSVSSVSLSSVLRNKHSEEKTQKKSFKIPVASKSYIKLHRASPRQGPNQAFTV